MTKHTRKEEGHLAAVFLTGSLMLAFVMTLRTDTNFLSAIGTVVFSATLLLTCILAGAWSGAWAADRRPVPSRRELWVDAGALIGFGLALAVVFRAFF